MKSIKEQVIEAYDKHYVSSCGEVVDLTLEKVEEIIDKIDLDYDTLYKICFVNKNEHSFPEIREEINEFFRKELKLSLKGAEKDEKTK